MRKGGREGGRERLNKIIISFTLTCVVELMVSGAKGGALSSPWQPVPATFRHQSCSPCDSNDAEESQTREHKIIIIIIIPLIIKLSNYM